MRVAAGGVWGATPKLRSARWSDVLLFPGEVPLATSLPLRSMEIAYRELSVSVFGWDTNWLVLYFAGTLLLSLLLKRPLGVEI